VSLEKTAITPKAVPTTTQNLSPTSKLYEEMDERFRRKMTRMFEKTTPPDVIALFKEKYCGLCCIKFSCEKFAKKHYEGRGHESLIRKKTFRNRPMGWQMVFHALISMEPNGATEEEIFEYILDTFSAHVSDDHQQVRADMVTTIKDMVERFKNVVNSNGVYRLRDRKPGEAPKPVPEGLVEKNYDERASKDQRSIRGSYSDSKRHPSDVKSQEKGEYMTLSSRNKDFGRSVPERSRDLKWELERDRSQRHQREEGRRKERDRSRDFSRRSRYRERSSSRGRSPRRSSRRHQSRSSHVRGSSPTDLVMSRRPGEVEMRHGVVKQEAAIIRPSIIGSNRVNSNCFPQSQQVVPGYPSYAYPTLMSMTTPGMAESLSALLSGIMTATRAQQTLTPPPTPEEFS